MNVHYVEKQFKRIGARAKVHTETRRIARVGVSIDIGRDREGEFFDIEMGHLGGVELQVVDTRPQIRHLLLMADQADGKHKFLCGHDERHWFVAAVPERAAAANVQTAFEALKPLAVRQRLNQLKVKPRKRNRRRNEAFIRQGEWFFLPVSGVKIDEKLVLHNEPIARSGGKPHMCE